MFQSAASSVVSVADFRTEKDGSETQEVRACACHGPDRLTEAVCAAAQHRIVSCQ